MHVQREIYCFTCLHGVGREPSIKLCGFTFSYFNLFVTFDLNFPVTPGGEGKGGTRPIFGPGTWV